MIALLRSRLRPEVCPFCFEQFRLRDTPFRCTTPPSRCPPEADPVRARVWEDTGLLGKVIPGSGRRVDALPCPSCSQMTRRRLRQELWHLVTTYAAEVEEQIIRLANEIKEDLLVARQ